LETKTATEFRYLRWGFDIVIALVLGLVTKVILDWLMRAPAMGPSIDAEGEVSSRRGHLRPLLPILPTVRASQRCIEFFILSQSGERPEPEFKSWDKLP
jgi:hypothetical protein